MYKVRCVLLYYSDAIIVAATKTITMAIKTIINTIICTSVRIVSLFNLSSAISEAKFTIKISSIKQSFKRICEICIVCQK